MVEYVVRVPKPLRLDQVLVDSWIIEFHPVVFWCVWLLPLDHVDVWIVDITTFITTANFWIWRSVYTVLCVNSVEQLAHPFGMDFVITLLAPVGLIPKLQNRVSLWCRRIVF